jgi:ABC-2 type transport system ATP-binding protein
MPPNAVEVTNVVKQFGTLRALDSVSLQIPSGQIYGLLGPNGAGKTTLISILCGLVEKDGGTVNILGLDLDKDLNKIQKRINIVLGFTSIGMDMSVKELLYYYCLLYNLDNSAERIKNAIHAVALDDKMSEIARDLSSGYKQRLLLAKALLNKPEVLFLDEPTVGLDVEIAIKIRALIGDLKKQGTTIILTTHNMFEVEELCDQIALISRGRIIAQGTVADIKKLIATETIVEIDTPQPEELSKLLTRGRFSTTIIDEMVHVRLKSEKDVPKLLAALSKLSPEIHGVRLLEPTLEEAFLTLVNNHA